MMPSGSHHASAPPKKTPAQNANAYATLKFSGIKPGIRDSANTTMKMAGKRILLFTKDNLARMDTVSNSEFRAGQRFDQESRRKFWISCLPCLNFSSRRLGLEQFSHDERHFFLLDRPAPGDWPWPGRRRR